MKEILEVYKKHPGETLFILPLLGFLLGLFNTAMIKSCLNQTEEPEEKIEILEKEQE
jgi:hypothetical protein